MKKVALLIIMLIGPPEDIFSQVTSIEIYGKVSTKVGLQFKEEKPLKAVKIQIVEVDNEPAEENLMSRKFTTNTGGIYKISLNDSILEDIEEVASLKLKYMLDDFKDTHVTVGPITESPKSNERSAKFENHTYFEQVDVVLVPRSFDQAKLILESFKIDTNMSIFRKGNIIKSSSPFKGNTHSEYFKVPNDFSTLKSLAGSRHTSGDNPVFERVYIEILPLIHYLSTKALKLNEVKMDSRIKSIFSDPSGVELFKVLIPAGKSFTTNTDSLSVDDIKLRVQIFQLMGVLLDELQNENVIEPTLKRALNKYKGIFSGFFEPLFILTVRNKDDNDYIFKQINVEVKGVEIYMGEEEKAKVPITAVYDIPIEPNVGIIEFPMIPELRIYPSRVETALDVVSFKIRLVPQTPYLHSYLMKFRILTDRNVEVDTPYFVIDM